MSDLPPPAPGPLADPFDDPRHDLVGGAPTTMGPWQLALLIGLGLDRDHTLLDLGCGTLRAGLHFIRFLAPSRYHGAEPDRELLSIGSSLVARAGLTSKAPRLTTLDDLDACGTRFDWLLTHSVLNHLDEAGTIATIDRVARVLAAAGRWVSTIRFDADVATVEPGAAHGRRAGEYWRSLTSRRWLCDVLASRRLVLISLDADHPRAMDVFMVTRSP